jgi:mono/diheme cytochrome c family protein
VILPLRDVRGRLGLVHGAALTALFLQVIAGPGLAETTADQEASKIAAGQQIYRLGILQSGEGITGVSSGDIPVSGVQVACENCHRRSGLGSSEGGKVVPPLTGQALFQSRERDQQSPFRSRSMKSRDRPAYDSASLAKAIRSGIDSGGNELDPLMPRYAMSDSDVEALAAYMETLASELPPGIDDSYIHLATIAARNADESDRQTMLEILQAFTDDKNANTRNESGRADRGPYYRAYRDDSYRKWILHVWQPEGDSETWPAQLEALYEAQPIFALVSGVGEGSWRPVHDFCESNEIPCIFPITDQPALDEDFYSIYLSGGLFRESQAVVSYLAEALPAGSGPVVQVYRAGSTGEAMARAFSRASAGSSLAVHGIPLASSGPPSAAFWHDLQAGQEPGAVLAWLSPEDLVNFAPGSAADPDRSEIVVLSHSLVGSEVFALGGSMGDRVRIVSLLELPERRDLGLRRLRTWLKPREIELTRERVQGDAFLAATLAGSAVKHMRRNFSREYMIEIIEHGLDNSVFRSVYPQLTLGPNQRFASKRAYILRPAGESSADWVPVESTPKP